MNTFAHLALRTAFTVLSVSASPALAECEGNGNPYAFAAPPYLSAGKAFATETWSEAHPQVTASASRPPSLAELLPSSGNEAPVQTASSLPLRATDGMVGYAGLRRPALVPDAPVLASRGGPARFAAVAGASR